MSSEIYVEFKVFKFKMSRPAKVPGDQKDLFALPADEVGVIVFGSRYSSNVSPQIPSWSIEFLGTGAEFTGSYLEQVKYYFDDGLSQSRSLKNGDAAVNHLAGLYGDAGIITHDDLHSFGAPGFRFLSVNESGVEPNAECNYLVTGTIIPVTVINDTAHLLKVLELAIHKKPYTPVHSESCRVWANRPQLLLQGYYRMVSTNCQLEA